VILFTNVRVQYVYTILKLPFSSISAGVATSIRDEIEMPAFQFA